MFGSLSRCPCHFNHRSFTILLHSLSLHISYTDLHFWYYQAIWYLGFSARRFPGKPTVFSRFFVKVHSSLLYRNMLDYVFWRSWSQPPVLVFYFQKCATLLKATRIKVFLLLVSCSMSSIIPRYLHSIHVASLFSLLHVFSDFVLFTRTFFSLCFGGSLLDVSMRFVIHPMSSVYCWFITEGLMLYFV